MSASALLFAASAATKASYTGYWSPYTLLFCIFMLFISLILAVVILIYAMMGRFKPYPPEEEDTHTQPAGGRAYYNVPGEELLDEEDLPAQEEAETPDKKSAKTAKEEKPTAAKRPRRKTGLLEIAVATGQVIPAFLTFLWIDNPAGQMRGATFGTSVVVLLLIAQIILIVQFIRRQNKLR